ncbi:hypothetical protein ACI2IY_06645 [Lysobacter enzymogenes]|uniref:hypothetical protein n=1 Tax=Lysobacter enzymogenes TaxID=69 RepID=UPI00384E3B7E
MNFVIAADHPCLPGHFPGRPLVPGVVLLERVLDALRAQYGEPAGLRLPQAKFLQPLLPGETAQIELDPVGPSRWRFRVCRGEDLLASGEIVADGARREDAPA